MGGEISPNFKKYKLITFKEFKKKYPYLKVYTEEIQELAYEWFIKIPKFNVQKFLTFYN